MPQALCAQYTIRRTAERSKEIIWGCQHTDINLITILPASTRPGLKIRRRDGIWIDGIAPPNCVIAQVGDMLEYLTAGRLMSAAHKVEAPKEGTTEGRLSGALFIHANPQTLFQTENPMYPPKTAYQMLDERLTGINLSESKK